MGSCLQGFPGPVRRLLQCGLSTSHSLLQASACSGVGSSMHCRGFCAPPWISMDCRGTNFTMGCRATSDPAPGAPPPSHSSLIFGACRDVPLTYSYFSLLWLQLLLHNNFVHLLNCLILEMLALLLMSSVLANGGSVLESSGIGSAGHREASGSFSEVPVLYSFHYQSLASQAQYTKKSISHP